MKAAVLYQAGDAPRYTDVPAPVTTNDKEVLITVRAAAIKHIDRSRASGQHYSSEAAHRIPVGAIIGGDGVGVLADGTRVYTATGSGMAAEQAVVDKDRLVVVPDALDDATAAALPNAVIGSAMGLRFRADMQPGDVVLINGATGVTGRMAVQLAKQYGAGTVIATGRNPDSLQALLTLGADEIATINQADADFTAQIRAIHARTPIDVIIDYLWGHSAALLLAALKGMGAFTHRTRFVSIGSMAGDSMPLSAALLRSVDLHLSGSGLGSWTRQQVGMLFSDILPEAFQLASDGKLTIETVSVPLAQIDSVYDVAMPAGKRLVVTMK